MPPVNDAWFLPDGVDELLPEQSERLEELRNKLLNVVRSHGYQLVSPPFIEFVDTLLTGAGQEFSLETFKLTDQLTGRMMGVRADMTPQVARIDAYRLNDSRPNRLCYLGTVLRALPEGFSGTRSPLQFGAEIYGHQGVHSDAEAIALMHTVLTTAGINNLYLDIGHVGIFRGLTQQAGLKQTAEEKLFGLMQRKALPEISAYLDSLSLSHNLKSMLLALSRLNGDESTLLRAKRELEQACETVQDALSYLQKIAGELKYRCPECSIHFDLAELRGYRYHTGVVFAAFVPGRGHEVARGGRTARRCGELPAGIRRQGRRSRHRRFAPGRHSLHRFDRRLPRALARRGRQHPALRPVPAFGRRDRRQGLRLRAPLRQPRDPRHRPGPRCLRVPRTEVLGRQPRLHPQEHVVGRQGSCRRPPRGGSHG